MAKKAYVYDGTQWVEITSQPTVATATTGNLGIVQLTDSVSNTSTTTAAVPNSVKTAYDFTSTVQARTLTGTAPITIDGANTAKDLSANRTIAVNAASTSASGVVQLSDSTNTTSSVLAATPTAVKSAYDLAAAAVPKSTVTAKGDLISATAASTIANLGVGADYTVLTALSSTSTGLSWASRNPDIQEFTGNGSWQKPAGRTVTFVLAIGGGGGGASGATGEGGLGGAGAVSVTRWFKTSDLSATETVTIGGGGAGGAQVAGTTRNAGVTGTATTFGTKVSASGGTGAPSTNSNPTTPGKLGVVSNTSGTITYDGGGSVAGVAATSSFYGTAGGGGGAGNTTGSGGSGGVGFGNTAGAGAGATYSAGSTGVAGGTATSIGSGGGGGAGGSTTGGAGGNGYQGGGGGGGARAGTNGGKGGNGGDGYCLVISW